MQLFDELATRLFDRPEMSENTPPMATALDVNWLADSSQRNSERCYWSVCDECCRARGDEARVCQAGWIDEEPGPTQVDASNLPLR